MPRTPPSEWVPLDGPLSADRRDPAGDDNSHQPLIVLHGFTQTRGSWNSLIEALDAQNGFDRPIIRVDLPGHGASSDVSADLTTTAALVVQTCGVGVYCGYSMGGRVALHCALTIPDAVNGLVTIGATPGIDDDIERRHRRIADETLADSIESIGVPAFIEQWLSQPMFAGLPRTRDDDAQRLSNTAHGLASSLRLCGTGTQDPLWSHLGELEMPALFLAGENDTKFAAIAERMALVADTRARFDLVPSAGHSAHMENPEATATLIWNFLQSNS